MKRRFLFAFYFLMASGVASYSQKVSIQMNNVKLEKVFNVITEQTGLSVAYSRPTVDPDKTVSITAKDEDLSSVLKRLFADSNVTFEISKEKVYLRQLPPPVHNSDNQKVIKVMGVIVDSMGEPIIGASVLVNGTTNGAITDFDGKFEINDVPENATLNVSYIGYKTLTLKANDKNLARLVLKEDTEVLEEVVVTALGIKRSEKALSYNVQQVNADEITRNKDANFVNSLSGKVAGVNINSSSSGVGGISKVVMRGTKSIMQSSNALYVIDGVPMYAGINSGETEFGSQGTTEPIADINPEDIESMSVLTGAAAAALYGSDAANGAIVITTKKGKEGKLRITVNSNTEFSNPFVMPKFQNRYGTSQNSVERSWGNLLNSSNNYGYDPRTDYFETGVTGTESISLSAGTEKNQTYASAAAVNSKGIIPNNKYNRYNFTFRNTTSFLEDRMTLDIGATYIRQNDRNMTNQGTYNNPLVGAYLFPRGNDWTDIQMYERYDLTRKIKTQYWPVGDAAMTMQNPYWINYRNLRENVKDRYMINANLNYKILDWLSVSGRVRLDNSINDYTEKFYASTNTQLTEMSTRGLYGISKSNEKQLYADFLVNINKSFGDDWNVQANIGASFMDMRYDMMKVRGPIADGSVEGEKVGMANVFNIQNLSPTKTERLQEGWREQTQSVFASAELAYKNTYYLTLTGRNDWPSQLAGPNSKNSSFFYPSVGLSVVLSELMPGLNKDYLSYMKLRGSFASVGVAFPRYIANPLYEWDKDNGWSSTTQYPVYDLKPERTESWELGLSLHFLKYFDMDITYYNTITKNQTFNPELPVSGWSKLYIQTGAVRNQGVELSLGFKNTWNKFSWESNYTFSTNKNKIVELADNAINPATGEKFSIETLNMGGLGETRFLLKEGGTMGDLYSLIDLKHDDKGNIYVDSNGNLSTETIKKTSDYIKLGSVLPKANMAWRNNFRWNNFNLGFLISARLGGVVFSRTQAILDDFGVSEASADARDRGYVLVNGDNQILPQKWYNTIGGGTSVPQYYTYSATNIRLQEASIGYTFPKKMLKNVCDINISLVGRNLLMIYNKAPFDPESVASTGNFYQGIDYFMMPSLRNYGISLSFKF